MTFVGIITPDTKNKAYINLVMGFLLIFIVISPISNLFAQNNIDEIFEDMEAAIIEGENSTVESMQSEIEQLQLNLVAENVRNNLILQLEEFSSNYGFFSESITMDISSNEDNFLEIRSINMILSDSDTIEENRSFIRIDRINIGTQPEFVENPRIDELKNFISEVYNLSVYNIHITIRE